MTTIFALPSNTVRAVYTTPEAMAFGMPVRVVFEPLTAEVTLPVWEPPS